MRQLGILGNWKLTDVQPADVDSAANEVIQRIGKVYEEVGKVPKDQVTYDNCIKVLIQIEGVATTDAMPIEFAQHCAESKPLREASVAAEKKLSDFWVEMSMKKDVFDNVVAFKERGLMEGLSAEKKRFVEREITGGRRNGLHLGEEEREQMKKVMKRMSELATEFSSNLGEDTTALEFTKEELKGVPEDLVNSFEKTTGGLLKVTMKYPHFFPVTRKCHVPETRRKMEHAYQSRCFEVNTKILEELVELRQKRADILGYESHASFVHELRMSKSPAVVAKFLSDLAVKLQPIWKKERAEFIALKEKLCTEHGHEFNGQLDFWDCRYIQTAVEETRYSVDQETLKQYFPLQKVTDGLFEIYQELLGLVFTECASPDAWHEDVKLFRVNDKASSETLGYFFVDLHPRDGKYGHAAIFDLQPSFDKEDGTRQVFVCAMMCNFSKPTAEKPSLLDHGEVETYFHEFGHVMHMICARTETPKFSGANVERDFVEAPSQMLENWCWKEETLSKMSGHYKDNSPIPAELMYKLLASRQANAGSFNLRQIILGTFDQRIHTTGKADTAQVFKDVYKEIIDIETMPGTNMGATFGHMCGYDAQYYGYMWSEVYSADMFASRFEKEGLLNPAVGMDYRKKVLEKGGSVDAMDMLKDFLGREPTDDAFLKSKGLGK